MSADVHDNITGEEILAIRKGYRISQSNLARMLNVDPATIRNWEKGRTVVSQTRHYLTLRRLQDNQPTNIDHDAITEAALKDFQKRFWRGETNALPSHKRT